MPHLPLAWQVRKMAHSSFGLFSAINLVLTQGGSHKAPTHKAPIGVFDSGVGGLSILNHLQKRLPHERYIYFADTAHVPYGERSDSEIETLTHEAVHWLYQQKCKLVVVACNSASAHSLHTLRSYYGDRLPVVGLVPAIKPAAQKSQTKHIAVLATKATLKGKLLADVIDEYARPLGVTVHPFFLPTLVPWVEAGMPSKHAALTDLTALAEQLKALVVDELVLGCTHYPFFTGTLSKLAPWLHVCDSGAAIARRVDTLLKQKHLTVGAYLQSAQSHAHPELSVFSTGNPNVDRKKIHMLLKPSLLF